MVISTLMMIFREAKAYLSLFLLTKETLLEKRHGFSSGGGIVSITLVFLCTAPETQKRAFDHLFFEKIRRLGANPVGLLIHHTLTEKDSFSYHNTVETGYNTPYCPRDSYAERFGLFGSWEKLCNRRIILMRVFLISGFYCSPSFFFLLFHVPSSLVVFNNVLEVLRNLRVVDEQLVHYSLAPVARALGAHEGRRVGDGEVCLCALVSELARRLGAPPVCVDVEGVFLEDDSIHAAVDRQNPRLHYLHGAERNGPHK